MREGAVDSWDSRQDSGKGVLGGAFAVAVAEEGVLVGAFAVAEEGVLASSSEGGSPLMEGAPS